MMNLLKLKRNIRGNITELNMMNLSRLKRKRSTHRKLIIKIRIKGQVQRIN